MLEEGRLNGVDVGQKRVVVGWREAGEAREAREAIERRGS